MADAPKALADVVCVTPHGRVTADRPTPPSSRWGRLFLCSDVLAVLLGPSFAAVAAAAFEPSAGFAALTMPAAVSAPGALVIGSLLGMGAPVIFWLSGHYSWRRPSGATLAEVTLTMASLGALHLVIIEAVFAGGSAFLPALGWIVATAALATGREAIKSRLAGSGAWFEPAVLVGDPDRVRGLAETVSADPHLALRVAEIVDPGEPFETIHRFRRRTVLISPPAGALEETQRLLRSAGAAQCRVALVLPGAGRSLGQDHHMLADGSTLVWLPNLLGQPFWQGAKRALDAAGSAFLLVALAPLFAILALPALLTGQPVFFAHRRVGRHGRAFTCYKFRTMVVGAEALLQRLLAVDETARREWESSYKLKNDPRVTPIGSFLRRTSLDELPQLWNVLRGDMSLVGPRPIVEDEVERYGEDAAAYFSVRPGITGLWQVSGRCDTAYPTRVAYDRWYVRNWTFGKDIGILVRTVWIVLTRTGAY